MFDLLLPEKMSQLREIAISIAKGKLALAEGELARERVKVCVDCEAFARMLRQCTVCHCMVDLKAKILIAECPLKKW